MANLVRQFGESIEYHASGSSGRSVNAIVVRDPIAILSEIGDALTGSMIVRVSNNDTDGISSTTIDTGTDRVALPLVVGGDSEMRSIVRVLSDSNGFTKFLVQ